VNGTTHAVTGTARWLVGCATAPLADVHPAPLAVAAGTMLAYAAGYVGTSTPTGPPRPCG